MSSAIDQAALAGLAREHAIVRSLWQPPPDLTVSEWAERFRVLSKETSHRPGPWRAEVYQRGIMDEFNNPETRTIVFQKSNQIGYTEILNNIIAYVISVDPKPMMMVRPTADDARDFSRYRFSNMVRDCKELRSRIRDAKEKRGDNTLRLKMFPGGSLKFVGANAGSGLRSDPLAVVVCDEIDGYPDDVDKEGDPIEIVKRRTDTFADYKFVMGSTPAKPKGLSRIEQEFQKSDQRFFNVPCPFCKFMQPLFWRNPKIKDDFYLRFEKSKDGTVDPASVRYICAGCKKGIGEQYKQQMLDAGRWIAEHPGRPVVGFFINALYSPWKEVWASMAQEFVNAQQNREKLRAFVNLRLGESFAEDGDVVSAELLAARREKYQSEVPAGVGALVLTVDTQDIRLEALVTGYGKDEESWLIRREIFWGDPGATTEGNVWEQLREWRLKPMTCAGGRQTMVDITMIDSGGHHTDAVYDFIMPLQNSRDRAFAIKGVDRHALPIMVRENLIKKKAVRLFTVATFMAKERIFSRLRMQHEAGKKIPAGYIHLPTWADEEFLAQITGEQKVPVQDRHMHVKKYIWKKTHSSNEALDLTVYALAGLHVLQQLLHRKKDLEAEAAELASPPAQGTPSPPPPRQG